MLVGIALLPVCVGTAKAVWLVLGRTGQADRVWLPMLAGAACWIVVFLLLPKPMWVYVFGHELTHAVWTWIFGGSVKNFKAGSAGGHVVDDEKQFSHRAGAVFFSPLRRVAGVGVCHGALFWRDLACGPIVPWFHLLLGAAYAFHLTLTWHILRTRQTDITSQGCIFSAAVIFLGNALVLLIGAPLLARRSLGDALMSWLHCNHEVLRRLVTWL